MTGLKNQRRGKHNSRGFTLLELMFAAGIVGLALVFLFGSLITISLASTLVQNRSVAATHISTVMEELHGLNLQQMLTYTPPAFQNLGLTETVQLEAVQSDGSVLTLPVNPAVVGPLPNPLEIRCRVSWIAAENRPLSLEASRFYYR